MSDDRAVQALLLDRDGTLIHDVPYNGDPRLVRPLASVRRGLERARGHGLALAIVSNQSGVARGLVDIDAVDAVNRRVDELLGPFDAIVVCPHAPDDGCECRKPRPGMLLTAAESLAVEPQRCVMIGDIGADMAAAAAAGSGAIMVPTAVTRREEIAAAPLVAPDFDTAVRWAVDGRCVTAD